MGQDTRNLGTIGRQAYHRQHRGGGNEAVHWRITCSGDFNYPTSVKGAGKAYNVTVDFGQCKGGIDFNEFDSLRVAVDYAHAKGMKLVAWTADWIRRVGDQRLAAATDRRLLKIDKFYFMFHPVCWAMGMRGDEPPRCLRASARRTTWPASNGRRRSTSGKRTSSLR